MTSSFLEHGIQTTVDPNEPYDCVLADAQVCLAMPVLREKVLIIRLQKRLSDLHVKRSYPEAVFIYENAQAIEFLRDAGSSKSRESAVDAPFHADSEKVVIAGNISPACSVKRGGTY